MTTIDIQQLENELQKLLKSGRLPDISSKLIDMKDEDIAKINPKLRNDILSKIKPIGESNDPNDPPYEEFFARKMEYQDLTKRLENIAKKEKTPNLLQGFGAHQVIEDELRNLLTKGMGMDLISKIGNLTDAEIAKLNPKLRTDITQYAKNIYAEKDSDPNMSSSIVEMHDEAMFKYAETIQRLEKINAKAPQEIKEEPSIQNGGVKPPLQKGGIE